MQIAQWEWQEPTVVAMDLDKNFGSGYPGDPPCVDWMKGPAFHPVFGYPNLVRFSWSTTRNCLEENKACKIEWECDEEDGEVRQPSRNFWLCKCKRSTKRYQQERQIKHGD